MKTSLTISTATYQDAEGCYFTLQALVMYHPPVHYLVIDNAPESCTRTKNVTHAVGGQYIHKPELNGPSACKDALFRLAKTEWVLCIDSHVLLELGAVQSLLDYIDEHPNSNDLIQGPLVFDDGNYLATHWHQTNPPGLWGQWGHYPCWEQDEPFDIPMHGMGLFCMRRQAWPGFNPLFRGFGGEEGYIHEKVRQRGGRCLCLPHLMWRHRFRDNDPNPPPYRLAKEDHVWNLLVGHRELGIDATEEIREEFKIPPESFRTLKEESERAQSFGGLPCQPTT